MIKRNVNQFAVLMVVLTLAFIWLLKLIFAADFEHRQNQQLQQQLATISSVDLLLSNSELSQRQNLAEMLQNLDSLSAINSWQLSDASGAIVSASPASNADSNAVPSEQSFYRFYFQNADNRPMTLRIGFIASTGLFNSLLSVEDMLLGLMFLALVAVIIKSRFYWIYQLESYARYILTHDHKLRGNSFGRSSNPISQAINHLMLSNSLLLKDKVELTEQIRKISYVDEATDLGNQLFFKAEFQVRLHNHEEPEEGLLVLLSFVELDENQTSILNKDDLQAIAHLLRKYVAEIPNALVARLRANDFAMLLPNQSQKNIDILCKQLFEKFKKGIFDRKEIDEHFLDIGISAYKQGFDYYKILAEADMALRNAQLQGGNNWFMYGEGLSENKVRGSLKWRSFLQNILEKRQVLLFVQQAHVFDTALPTQLEVLARIKDGKEFLTADTFLPMASQCGLAAEFDRQVVDGVIKYCLYRERGSQDEQLSINLFISSLLDEKFVGWLVGKLSSYPQLCRNLTFEVKEVHVNSNLSALRLAFSQLTELGVSWCIERFGSPDEDLSFLDLLPIKRVKLDRRIVHNIHQDKARQLLLKTLLINLKSRQIEVFADGVEKEEDVVYLQKAGVDGAQGFYFGPPAKLGPEKAYLKAV